MDTNIKEDIHWRYCTYSERLFNGLEYVDVFGIHAVGKLRNGWKVVERIQNAVLDKETALALTAMLNKCCLPIDCSKDVINLISFPDDFILEN